MSGRKVPTGMARSSRVLRAALSAASVVVGLGAIADGAGVSAADAARYEVGDLLDMRSLERITGWLRSAGYASEDDLPQFRSADNLVSRGCSRGTR